MFGLNPAEILIKQFVTPENINKGLEMLFSKFKEIPLEPGETNPSIMLVPVNADGKKDMRINVITCKSVEIEGKQQIVVSRIIQSFNVNELQELIIGDKSKKLLD